MIRKIAFISEHASPLACLGGVDSGGQNVYVAELARQLARSGYEIDIFTRRDQHEQPQVVNWINGIRVIHIAAGPAVVLPKEYIYQYMQDFVLDMQRFIAQSGRFYDLIHAHFWMSAFVAGEIKKALKIPFVVTFHALAYTRLAFQQGIDRFPQERFEIEQAMIVSSDQVIAVCPQDREDLIAHYGADPQKITMIPCGYNPDEFYQVNKMLARMILGIEGTGKVILQLGRMVARKGIDNVIAALGIMKRNNLEIPLLLIVGGETDDPAEDTSDEMRRLRVLVSSWELSGNVRFMGRRNRDLLKYFYSAADLFITTPWYEPFGITPLEAMACGTPVIGSNVGGIKFSIRHQESGLLVEPKSPVELAQAIEQLLNKPVDHSRFSENGKLRANSLFTWQEVARQMSRIYNQTISSFQSPATAYNTLSFIEQAFQKTAASFLAASTVLAGPVSDAASRMVRCLQNGRKILICGNGGSAAESQHLAAELVGRFRIAERRGLPAISLAADTAVITAWANDFSFNEIFSRQVEAIGQAGDLLICLSTSGTSPNIISAIRTAEDLDMDSILLTGGTERPDIAGLTIRVPSDHTPCIQEVHLHIIHTLCDLVENQLFESLKLVPSEHKQKAEHLTSLEGDGSTLYLNTKSA